MFRVIDDATHPIIVPWDRDTVYGLIDQLRYIENPGRVLRQLQPYTVTVWPHELTILEQAGAVERVAEIVTVLRNEKLYRKDVGLLLDEFSDWDPEQLIV